jgi:hypothetical protein
VGAGLGHRSPGLSVDGFQPHPPHQPADLSAVDVVAPLLQDDVDFAAPEVGPFQMDLVDLQHKLQVVRIFGLRPV